MHCNTEVDIPNGTKGECNFPVPQASLLTHTEKTALVHSAKALSEEGSNVSQTELDKDENKMLPCGALIRMGQVE